MFIVSIIRVPMHNSKKSNVSCKTVLPSSICVPSTSESYVLLAQGSCYTRSYHRRHYRVTNVSHTLLPTAFYTKLMIIIISHAGTVLS